MDNNDVFDFLDTDENEDVSDVQAVEAFSITNDSTADWAVERIIEENAEADRLVSIASAKIEELTEKIKKIEERRESKVGYFKSLLAQYFETVPHKKTKTQEQYKLISGTLIRKHKQPKIEYDVATLTAYLEANEPEYVEVKKRPKWGEFKKKLDVSGAYAIDKETGETLDFITVEPQADAFEVKF